MIGNLLWGPPGSGLCERCVIPQQSSWKGILGVLRRGMVACAGAHPAQCTGGGRGVGAAASAPHVALAGRAAGLPGLAIRPPHAGTPLNIRLQCVQQRPGTPTHPTTNPFIDPMQTSHASVSLGRAHCQAWRASQRSVRCTDGSACLSRQGMAESSTCKSIHFQRLIQRLACSCAWTTSTPRAMRGTRPASCATASRRTSTARKPPRSPSPP